MRKILSRKRLKKFVKRNEFRLLVILATYVFLQFLAGLPYLNVVFSKTVIFLMLFLMTIRLFKFGQLEFAKLAVITLVVVIVATLFNLPVLAETLGNFIYLLISLWLGYGLVDYFKEVKNER